MCSRGGFVQISHRYMLTEKGVRDGQFSLLWGFHQAILLSVHQGSALSTARKLDTRVVYLDWERQTVEAREARVHRSWRVVCRVFSRPRPGAFVWTRCAPSRLIFLLSGCWGPKSLYPTSAFLCSTPRQPSLRLEDFNTISLVPGAQQQPVTCDTEPR